MPKLLQIITKNIQEAEEDLFPGFDPTVFDEHLASKKAADTVDTLSRKIKRLELASKSSDQRAKEISRSITAGYMWQNHPPHFQPLAEQPWLSKYPIALNALSNMIVVDTSSPKFKNLERKVAAFESARERAAAYKQQIKKLKSKLLRVRKQESTNTIKNKAVSTPHRHIDVTSMPRTFTVSYRDTWSKTTKTETFSNPYFLSEPGETPFADYPVHFAWEGHLRTVYFELSRLIEKLGLPEFDMMYANMSTTGNNLKYYLTNKDGSAIVTNQIGIKTSTKIKHARINIFLQDQKNPSGPLVHVRTKKITSPFIDEVYDKVSS